jgi:hypothetical protein
MPYLLAVFAFLPVEIWSFSFSTDGMVASAESFFNGLMPAFIPIVGIVLAFGIIGMVLGYLFAIAKFKGSR